MDSPINPDDLKLAAHLANPFMLPGQSGQPLSLRMLADGGMVVIAHDGRKMWFTALEVCRARQAIHLPAVKPPKNPGGAVLKDPDPNKKPITSKPPAYLYDTEPGILFLPKDQQYLEDRINEHLRRTRVPRPKHTRR